MTLSAAIEEAYASGDEEGVTLSAFQIDHPSFDEPLYGVRGFDDAPNDPDFYVMLPIEPGGEKIRHKPCGFSLTPPGSDNDGPTDGKVTVDAVSMHLYPYLKDALGYGEPITITFRQYQILPDGLGDVTAPDEEIAGLQLSNVTLTATSAEGTVAWPDGRKFNVPTGPDAFFDRESYPALFS
jgi:hypothetical protein